MVILDILASMFASVWGLFTGTMVPGLGVPCSSLLIAIMAVRLSISLVRHTFGFGGSGTGYRSGSAKDPKISKERKDDAY